MTHSWRVALLVGHLTVLLILIDQIVQMHLLHWMQSVTDEGFKTYASKILGNQKKTNSII